MSERDKHDALRTVCNRQKERIADLERQLEAANQTCSDAREQEYGCFRAVRAERLLAEAQKLPEEIDEAAYNVYGSGWNDCLRTIRQMRYDAAIDRAYEPSQSQGREP